MIEEQKKKREKFLATKELRRKANASQKAVQIAKEKTKELQPKQQPPKKQQKTPQNQIPTINKGISYSDFNIIINNCKKIKI